MASKDTATAEPAKADAEDKMNYFQKLWAYRRYLVVEPFFFFFVMASMFNSIAIINFPLDKACRVNLGYAKIVCDTVLDKSELGIKCDGLNFDNTTMGATPDVANITVSSLAFNYTVCKAQVETNKLIAEVAGKRAAPAAVFTLIVLLFAGGWADRYNKRKPFMIMPIVGAMLSFVCLLISAIFFETLPMEFGVYLESIIPSLFGGFTLCMMSIYSYMTISTPPEDRIFRFGVFAMFVMVIPFIGQPVSGILYKKLGYILSFCVALTFQAIAILLIVFLIKEIKPEKSKDTVEKSAKEPLSMSNGTENLAYETTKLDDVDAIEMNSLKQDLKQNESLKADTKPKKCSCLSDIFDPTLFKDCLTFPFIPRENNERMLLLLLIMAYFLTVCPGSGEGDYFYQYTLLKLNWNGTIYSIYNTVSAAITLTGTFIGTAILSKMLKISDSTIGILSALSVVLARLIYPFATTTPMFYVGSVVEMFVSLRVIAIKTIGSSIVAGEELNKMYALFGISEPIGQFIFPPLYSQLYQRTVNTFPGAFFLFTEIFYVPNIIVFILCYFILRRHKNKNSAIKNTQSAAISNVNSETEVTRL